MKRHALTALLVLSPVAAFGQSAGSGQGLDALSDDRLLTELAARNLDVLLDRAFDVNQVPQGQRKALLTTQALAQLSQQADQMPLEARRQLVQQAIAGIEQVLPETSDPGMLMNWANVLIAQGAQFDVQILEYWGRNPRTQARLKPVVETSIKILGKTVEAAAAEKARIEQELTQQNRGRLVPRWEQANAMMVTAEYTKHNAEYYLALALDPASPRRAEVAAGAAEYLSQFDTDAQDPAFRAQLKTQIAKLKSLVGDEAASQEAMTLLEEARTLAGQVNNRDLAIEAYVTPVIVQLRAGKPPAAGEALTALRAYLESANAMDLPGMQARLGMLDWRILDARAQQASGPAQARARDEAIAALAQLAQDQPALRSIIFEQLRNSMPDDPDVSALDPLVLTALLADGEAQIRREEGEELDAALLGRAIEAARELVRRGGQEGVPEATARAAKLLLPFMLEERGGEADLAAAANAYLDYAATEQEEPQNAAVALNNAQALIGRLRESRPTDPAVAQAYDRFLGIAIEPPFERSDLAFQYAFRLQRKGEPAQAVEVYDRVPEESPNFSAARYFQMVALAEVLDTAAEAERPAILTRIQQLADGVRSRAQAALGSAEDATQAAIHRSRLVRTTLLAADIARRAQDEPARAVDLLQGFEEAAAGLVPEGAAAAEAEAAQAEVDRLLGEALEIRVQSLMALGQNTRATRELKALLEKTGGQRGAQIVYNLLTRLNDEFDAAQARNDAEDMREIASARAMLTPELVAWASSHPDEDIRKYTYRYQVFDAETQRQAAMLQTGEARTRMLRTALERFEELEQPENERRFFAGLTPEQLEVVNYDPQIVMGVGRVQYALEDYAAARARFSRLLADRQLGRPVMIRTEAGQQREVDNDDYWEAIYKFVRSNVALDNNVNEMKTFLKRQYVTWGDRVGGTKWRVQFEQLRQELVPEFDPETATAG